MDSALSSKRETFDLALNVNTSPKAGPCSQSMPGSDVVEASAAADRDRHLDDSYCAASEAGLLMQKNEDWAEADDNRCSF